MWGKGSSPLEREEHIDGDQTSRLTGVDEGFERLLHWNVNRTGFVGGRILREDVTHGTTEQVLAGAARTRRPDGL
jgi:hypothetical protein